MKLATGNFHNARLMVYHFINNVFNARLLYKPHWHLELQISHRVPLGFFVSY